MTTIEDREDLEDLEDLAVSLALALAALWVGAWVVVLA